MRSVRTYLVALALATACLANAQGGDRRWLPQNQVLWSTMTNGNVSRMDSPYFQMLGSENEFQTYWTRATGQAPSTTPKSVNWQKEKVVVIHLGRRPSSGYTVNVTSLEKNGISTIIHAMEHTPVNQQWVSESPSSPYVIIRVPRDTAQVQLDLKKMEGGANGGVTIYGNGGAVIHLDNYDRVGGGSIDPNNSVNWGSVTFGNNARVPDSGVYPIENPWGWAQYWNQVTGERGDAAPGGIDWNSTKLVAIHLGERPTTGYRVRVLSVEKDGTIRAVEEMPVPGSYVTKRKTFPYAVVRVPRSLYNFHLDLTKREGDGGVRRVGG